MNTIEEMRTAVLAYCEEVCPNVSIYVTPIGFGDLCIHKDESEDSGPCWHIGTIGRPKIRAIIQPKYFNSDRQIDECIAAYRLLGLETRDAESHWRGVLSEMTRTKEEYISELEARNTALVAAGKALVAAVKVGAPITESIIHQLVEFEKALAAKTGKGGMQG